MGAADEITSAIIRGGVDFVRVPDKWEWSVCYATDQEHMDTAYVYGLRKIDNLHIINEIFDVLRSRGYRCVAWRRYERGLSRKVHWPLYRNDGSPRIFRAPSSS